MQTQTAKVKNEKPIIFSSETVRKILSGKKTQTRRVMKNQPVATLRGFGKSVESLLSKVSVSSVYGKYGAWAHYDGFAELVCKSPYGKVGDLLWVRENWGYGGLYSGTQHLATVKYLADGTERKIPFKSFDAMMDASPDQNLKYPADYDEMHYDDQQWCKSDLLSKWWERQKSKPSIHMPRWVSRITLEITNIKVERLQDISEADVKAEGFEYLSYRCAEEMKPCDPKEFSDAWDLVNENAVFLGSQILSSGA